MPPCPQSNPCDLQDALSAAGANTGGGTVHVIGQLTWTGNTLDVGTANGPVYLLGNGNGTGGTVIDVSQPTALHVSYGSSVDSVRIRAQDVAVDLAYGSMLSDSVVQATATSSTGVAAAALTGALSSAQAIIANDSVTAGEVAVSAPSGSTSQHLVITDSTLSGVIGILDAKVPADVFRSTINADGGYGLYFDNGPTSYVSSSVIHMSGSNSGPVGAYVAGPTTLYLLQDTIDGVDSSGINETGVLATEGFMLTESRAIVKDSIVRGFANDLWAQPGAGTNAGGHIDVSSSDVSTRVESAGDNPGHISDSGGNVDQEASFVDRPGGDYRLRFDSPLIDAGGSSPLDANEDGTDR